MGGPVIAVDEIGVTARSPARPGEASRLCRDELEPARLTVYDRCGAPPQQRNRISSLPPSGHSDARRLAGQPARGCFRPLRSGVPFTPLFLRLRRFTIRLTLRYEIPIVSGSEE